MPSGYGIAKRILDTIVAASALIVLAPLLLGLGIAVSRKIGAPALFRQQRTGLNGTLFTILKFRTISDAVQSNPECTNEADRIPPFGWFLRTTGLDELPQLWNILRGDMSFIGPRPLLPHYETLYTAHQRRRLSVRPGLTGWAQVNGRSDLPWEQQFELDVWYVDHRSAILDVRIIGRTVQMVYRQSKIGAGTRRAMREQFNGASHASDQSTEHPAIPSASPHDPSEPQGPQ